MAEETEHFFIDFIKLYMFRVLFININILIIIYLVNFLQYDMFIH